MTSNVKRRLIERKRSFVPTLVTTGLLWFMCISIIFATEPEKLPNQLVFILVLFLALFFTFTIIFTNKRRGVIASLAVVIFLVLSYFGVGSILNFLLVAGIAFALERLTA